MSGNPAQTKKAVRSLIIVERRSMVMKLRLRGLTKYEIAAELKCSIRTIGNDIEAISREFIESSRESYAYLAEIERLRLEEIHRKAMEGYEDSRNPKEVTTVDKSPDGKVLGFTIREEAQAGNPAFLEAARKASESRRKLLGLDVQPTIEDNRVTTNIHNTQVNVAIVEDDNWYGNDAHDKAAKAIAASDPGVIESGAVQSGSVWPKVGQNGNGSNGHH